MTPRGRILLGRALLPIGTVLLTIGILGTVARSRFDPIFQSLQCTSPLGGTPLMAQSGVPAAINADMQLTVTCENPNPYSFVLTPRPGGTAGTMLMPNHANLSSEPAPIGHVNFEEIVLPPKSTTSYQVSFAVAISQPRVVGMMGYLAAHGKTMPMYWMRDPHVDLRVKFMLMTRTMSDVATRKYCGYYMAVTTNNGQKMLGVSSHMVCRPTLEDMKDELAGVNATEGPGGSTNNLRPSPEKIDQLGRRIRTVCTVLMAVGYGLGIASFLAAAYLLSSTVRAWRSKLGAAEPKPQPWALEGDTAKPEEEGQCTL